MLLVTGATGNVGRELVGQLSAAGLPSRALIRRPEQARWLPAGVSGVVGDLGRPETFADELVGVTAIHLLAGYDNLDALLAAARAAGVRRIVLQSSSSVPSGDLSNAVARYHILAERAIRDSGLGWTFLQPNSFMTNTLEWRGQLAAGGTITAAFPDVAVATVDPADIAAVSLQALTSDAHAGHSYRLSGPAALRPADRVAILARVLDRPLRFRGLSDAEARAEMEATMPTQYVDAFFSFFATGTIDETTVHPTVEEVVGRPPRTFEQWARAHAAAFGSALNRVGERRSNGSGWGRARRAHGRRFRSRCEYIRFAASREGRDVKSTVLAPFACASRTAAIVRARPMPRPRAASSTTTSSIQARTPVGIRNKARVSVPTIAPR